LSDSTDYTDLLIHKKIQAATFNQPRGAFCGSVPTKLELQQWQRHIAAKKRRERRTPSPKGSNSATTKQIAN